MLNQQVLLINGPNLGTLGKRKPEIYGSDTLQDIVNSLSERLSILPIEVKHFQSNHEGNLIDFIEENYSTAGMIINPGALMMSGWSLRDALEAYPNPIYEVHISNIYQREAFRHHSIISELADGVLCGMGARGYVLALEALLFEMNQ